MSFLKKIFILTVGIFIFCNNPFKTREPEPPTEGRTSWVQPTSPSRVITNLENSIIEADVPNYMECLTDTIDQFRFIPDEFVRQNNVGIFDNWTLNQERNYFTNVVNATLDSSRKVNFTNIQTLEDNQDSVLIKLDYDIEIHHNLSGSYPDHVQGQANFWLKSNNVEWYITRWQDFGTADNKPSWSSIKASFGN